MEVKATAQQVRISANKVRQVLALIRGKKASDALLVLKYTPNKGARLTEKVLKSAIANAEHNFDMYVDNLYVSEIFIDQGPTLKRIHPRSRGQAFKILKRTSHVTVVVKERA